MNKPKSKVFEALEKRGMTPRGERFDTKCPAHDDKRKSLVIGIGDNGATLLTCHAGCTPRQACEALQLKMSDLWPPSKTPWVKPEQGRVVANYDYFDETGVLLYQVQRMDPKDFRQRKPDGSGWAYRLGNVRRVLYRLPELTANPGRPCFIVEGEKDVHTLEKLGFLATTCAGGSGGWVKNASEYAKQLGTREVVVIPDNDPAGLQFAQDVMATVRRVLVVRLPGANKSDVTDWVSSGLDLPGEAVEELKLRVILAARLAVETAKKRLDTLAAGL